MSELQNLQQDTNKGFNKQFASEIDGQHTEFVFHNFENSWFMLITQYGKIGNLFEVIFDIDAADPKGRPEPVEHPEFHSPMCVSIKSLFGSDTDEIRGGIQFLIDKSNLKSCPSRIIISLSLKEINGKILRQLTQVINEYII